MKGSFNSIKVRLKLWYLENRTVRSVEFQFHKGTIKTDLGRKGFCRRTKFQFHKGTIKTKHHGKTQFHQKTFQFHKGTIKTKGSTFSINITSVSIP